METNNPELRYVEGDFHFGFVERRVYDYFRPVIALFKGNEQIGHITYHPAAEQIVFHPTTALTKRTIQFIATILDEDVFYKFWWDAVQRGLVQ